MEKLSGYSLEEIDEIHKENNTNWTKIVESQIAHRNKWSEYVPVDAVLKEFAEPTIDEYLQFKRDTKLMSYWGSKGLLMDPRTNQPCEGGKGVLGLMTVSRWTASYKGLTIVLEVDNLRELGTPTEAYVKAYKIFKDLQK